jgi:hypothetical protein
MPPAKIDSLADDVKSMVLGLLEQIAMAHSSLMCCAEPVASRRVLP